MCMWFVTRVTHAHVCVKVINWLAEKSPEEVRSFREEMVAKLEEAA